MAAAPNIVILAGPNGAGKSTAAASLLLNLGIPTFVNADVIARELAPEQPERVAFGAGRRMLVELAELAAARQSFALETTMSGRGYAPWLRGCLADGYDVQLVFLWLPDADTAVQRVARRVQAGGHSIPEDVIRRRYLLGIRNFMHLYRPIVTRWELFDNVRRVPRLIARGAGDTRLDVVDQAGWLRIQQQAKSGG